MKEAAQSVAPGRAGAFGVLLRRAREAAGLTQEELAERAGLSVNAIGALERGVSRHPYPATVRALAGALDLSTEACDELLRLARRPARSTECDTEYGLPVPRSSLIGREQEIAEVVALLRRRDVSIVTLTGPGGAGKTRLALSAAAEYAQAEGIEAVFISLAPIREPRLVLPTIARAFGIHEAGGLAVDRRLIRALRERRRLLLLDNFEQVIGAAGALSEALAGAPEATVLITSRERLRIDGEAEYVVQPLALPAADAGLTEAEIRDTAAVRLFDERAWSAGTRSDPVGGSARDVLEICRRVDGLPLAIELAAARTRLLAPVELLHRLDVRLPLLTGGNRDAPPRQQTMRDTIAWSYALLDPEQQRLFRQMSVFAGGATLDAIEAVAGSGALDGVEGLLSRSLLYRSEGGGEPRFVMLETIAEFAGEQLSASGEEESARNRHLDYAISLADRATRAFSGEHPERFWMLLETEIDNLRAALAWAAHRCDAPRLLYLCGRLAHFWTMRGRVIEGRSWLRVAFNLAGIDESLRTWVSMQHGLPIMIPNILGSWPDVIDRTRIVIAEELERVRREGDLVGECLSLRMRAVITWYYERDADAIPIYEEALAVARRAQAPSQVAWTLMMLGSIHSHANHDPAHPHQNTERAVANCQEALNILERLGDRRGIARALHGLGFAYYHHGEFDRALELLQRSLRSWLAIGFYTCVDALVRDMGDIAMRFGDPAWAARLYGASHQLSEQLGYDLDSSASTLEDQAEICLIREAIGDAAYDAEYAAGRALTFDQAVEEALAVTRAGKNKG